MTGTAIELNIDTSGVKAVLDQFRARTGNLKPAMKIMGEIIRTSVVRNFEESGRPQKWPALSPTTLKTKQGGSILIGKGFRGGLLGSIHSEPGENYVLVGTDKVYAAIHQFGGKAGRKLKTTIPARPYLMIQDEDITEIIESLKDWLAV